MQTNYRFRTSQHQARRQMDAAVEEEMRVLLKHETDKLRKKLSGSHADDPLSIRRDLASKDPVQILLSIFNACNNYFRGPQQAKVGAFMQMVTEKPALRHLFLLAIYEGAYGADRLMPKFMEDHAPSQATPGVSSQQDLFLQPQGIDKPTQTVYAYGVQCLSTFPSTTHLCWHTVLLWLKSTLE